MKNFLLSVLLGILLVFSNQSHGQTTSHTIGSGTSTTSIYGGSPINVYYRTRRSQMVYTKTELNNAGITKAGYITKLGFYVDQKPSYSLNNFKISMAHTTASNSASHNTTTLSQVYSASSYSPTAGGFDLITLDTAFVWNGSDNIVIDVCNYRNSGRNSTGRVRYYSATSGYREIASTSSSASYCNSTTGSTYSYKPQIQFSYRPLKTIDVAVTALDSPSTPFAAGNQSVVVRLENRGLDTITKDTIKWMVNGVMQTAAYTTDSLKFNGSNMVRLGSYNFLKDSVYAIKAWSVSPNDSVDKDPSDDTLSITGLYTGLSGTYTIGGTNPDYSSFNAAITALDNGGIAGPVVFNVRNGTYNESISLINFAGLSGTNTITFQSESGDSSKVVLQKLLTNSPLVDFVGASYISIRKMTLRAGSGSTRGMIVQMRNASNNITLSNNYISGISSNSTSSNDAIIYMGTTNENDITLENNEIVHGSYGLYARGTSTGSLEEDMLVQGNRFRNQYYRGLYMAYTKGANVLDNNMTTNSTYSSFRGYNFDYCDNGFKFNGNEFAFVGSTARTGAAGAFITYCDGSSSVPNQYMKNKLILGTSGYNAIRIDNSYYGLFANNLLQSAYNSTSTYTFYLYNSRYFDLFYNTIYNSNTSSRGSAYYDNRNSNLELKNNLFMHAGGGYAAYFANNIPSISDYNAFYSEGNAYSLYYYGQRYLSQWQTNYSRDANSIVVDPEFAAYNNLAPRNYLYDGSGIPVSGVGDDYSGNTRPITNPDIGGYEFTAPANDAGVISYEYGRTFCDDNNRVYVKIKNYGSDTLKSATINWAVGGTNQGNTSWTGALAQGASSDTVYLGSYNFVAGTAYTFDSWTTKPNGGTEGHNHNDSLGSSGLYKSLTGSYTIGGSNPDFSTIGSAITALNNGGVCGPVVLNIRNGNYIEDFTIQAITGSSSTNTITFQSESGDSSKVTIGKLQTNSPLVNLNGAQYVIFNKITLQLGGGSSYGVLVGITGSTGNVTFQNCQFIGANTNSTSTNDAIISSSSSRNSGCTFNNNLFLYGSYGLYLYGTSSSSRESNTVITNNTFSNQYTVGMQLYYHDGPLVKGNTISTNTANTSFMGIRGEYLDNGMEIDSNHITFTGSTALTNAYGFYLRYCDVNGLITKNRILLGDDSGLRGIYMYLCRTGIVANNQIEVGSSSSSCEGLHVYDCDYYDIFYNSIYNRGSSTSAKGFYTVYSSSQEIKNNSFYCENGYYPLYISSTLPSTIDYNNYYSDRSTNIYYSGTRSLASWQTNYSKDANSISVNPEYTSNTVLQPRNFLLDGAGLPVSGIGVDYLGNTRPLSNPDIGAFEFTAPAKDAGISELSSNTNLCDSSTGVFVKIKNYGRDTLKSATINWSVNGSTQTSYSWTGSLAQGAESGLVRIGSFTYLIGTSYNTYAWTTAPNNGTEGHTHNDSSSFSGLYLSLSGDYTIGGTNPDFAKFSDAITALNRGGVCGPVNFKIRNGTYVESFSLGSITGASSSNLITFESHSGDSSKVTIGKLLTTSPLISLNGAQYVRFKDLTLLVGSGSTSGRLFDITGSSSNITITNCRLVGSATQSTSNSDAIIYSSGSVNDYITVSNNRIEGGSYGVLMYGTSTGSLENYTTIQNNRFINQQTASIELYYQNYTDILDNEITSNSVHYSYSGIYCYYADRIDIIGNSIEYTGSDAQRDGYGIYLYYCDNAVQVMRNKVVFGESKGLYGLYFNRCNTALVANNLVQVGYNSSSTAAIYLYSTSNYDLFYNNFHTTSSSSSSSAITMYSESSIELKSNVFANTGNGYAYETLRSFTPTASDYNGFYAVSNSVVRDYTSTRTLSSWQSNRSRDQNSIESNPDFISTANPEVQHYTYDNAGVPVSGVSDDYAGNTRPILGPDIGAHEFTAPRNDAGIAEIDENLTLCRQSGGLYVKVKNFGRDTLKSLSINWKVNGIAQTPYSWTGSLTQGQTSANVKVGNYTFKLDTAYQIVTWTTSPNNNTDSLNYNDTAVIGSKYVSLIGTYTIGGSSPDFSTISKAVTALNNGGICGAVKFNIRNGTYNESFSLSNITGSSATNTITFSSENGDSSKVTVTSLLTSNPLLKLSNCEYITFEKMSFQMGVGSSTASTIYLQNNAHNITFRNCRIIGSNTNSTSANESTVYSNGYWNDNITFSNNLILYGSYGMYLEGTSSYLEEDLLIENNTFQDQYYMGLYARYQDAPEVKNNTITTGIGHTSYHGIYLSYADNGLNVEGNTIKNSGNTALSSAYGIYLLYCDGSANKTHKNRILFESGSGYMGIYVNRSRQGTLANNLIKVQRSSTAYGIYLYDSDNYNLYYNSMLLRSGSSSSTCFYTAYSTGLNVKDNIFFNDDDGYCLYHETTSSFTSLDYNAYWARNNSSFMRRRSSSYTFANWLSSFSYDGNSINESPDYDTEANLQPTNYLFDDAGIPVSGIGTDINDSTRSIFNTDIGSYEFTYPANDAGVVQIVSSSFCGAGSNAVKVRIKNYGRDTLKSVTIAWKVNGNSQTSYSWTGSIPQGNTSGDITLGSFSFAIGTNYTIEASTSKPNGGTEGFSGNDRATTTTQMALSGTYTIGNNSDFSTFSSAVSALSSGGVCAPVVFNVKNGTYVETLSLGEITGASATNTITFKSANGNRANVVLGQLISSGAIITMNGTDYITFKDMTIQVGSGSSGGNTIYMYNGANSNTFENNQIVGVASTSSSTNNAVIYSSTSLDYNNRFEGNYIKHGSYGIFWQGSSSSSSGRETGTEVISNSFDDQYIRALYLNYQTGPKAIDNYITTSSSYSSWIGIYIHYCYDDVRVQRNTVDVNATSSFSGGSGIYLYYADDDVSISRNHITFGAQSGRYGMILNYLTNAVVDNNVIQVGYNSSTYGIYQYYGGTNNKYYYNSVNVDSRYSLSASFHNNYGRGYTCYNNVFANTGSGYSVYYFPNSSTYVPTTSDYNSFYRTSGSSIIRYRTSNYSLSTWNSQFSRDGNSNVSTPNFPSNTNLRSCNQSYYLKGTAISSITYDYDGTSRPSSGSTSIGAFEFDTAFVVNLGADTSICQGNSLRLDAGHPGSTYLWSTNDTTRTISVSSGGNVSVRVINSCGTARDTIKVTQLNSTLAINLGNDTTICDGKSVSLDAGNANTSATYSWSTSATTQKITASTSGTYRVSVKNACGTLTDSIKLTVTKVSANAGSDKTITIGNSTGLSGSASGSTSYTYTWKPGNLSGQTVTVKPSSTTEYVMTATDPNGCFETDTVKVTVQGTAVSGSITGDTSLCAGESTTLSVSTNGGSGNYNYRWAGTNNTSSSITVTPTSTRTYKVIFEDANNTANTDSVEIRVSVSPTLGAPATTGAQRCGAGTLNLTAIKGTNGNTCRWYNNSSGGTALHTGTSYTTSALTSTTSYYVSTYDSLTGCESTTRTQVTATINPVPGSVTVSNGSRCGNGAVVLAVTPGSGGNTARWFSASSGGSALTTSTSYTTPSLSSTTTYYVSSYNASNGCESTNREAIVATINPVPSTPSVTGNDRCGTGSVTLSASPGTNGNTAIWYTSSTSTIGLDTTTSFSTGSISSSTTYYVSSYHNTTGCESSSRTSVSAIVNSVPAAVTTTDNERCGSGSVSLSATIGSNATTARWYGSATSSTLLGTGTSYSTSSISSTTDYYVTGYNATTGCESTTRTKVTATINATPAAPSTTGAQRCGSASSGLTLYATAGSGGNTCKWYTASSGGSLLSTGTSYNTGNISSTTDYYVSSYNTITGCESTTRTKVTARIGAIPSVPTAGNNERCGSGSVAISAKAGANGTTCIWYTAATGGTALDTTLTYNTPSLSATKSYYASTYNPSSGCESATRTKVTASINAVPGLPTLADNDRCGSGSVDLTGTPDTLGTTLRWYASSTSGSFLTTNTKYTTSSLTSTTTFYASTYNINTGCESSSRSSATVTINSVPAAPTTTGASACGGNSSVNLSATVGSNGNTCRWYSASTGGKLLNTGTSFNTGVISASTDYYVSSYNTITGCESTTRTKVTATIYSNVPGTPTTTSASICGAGTVSLSAKAGTNASSTRWYVASTGGSVLSTGLSYTTPTLSSTTTYYVSSYNSTTGCESSTRTSVTATINAIPSAPSTTSDARCGTGTLELKATAGTNGNTVRWYASKSSTSVLNTGTTYTTSSLSSTSTYYASSYNSTTGCEDTSRTLATATVNPIPSAPSANNDSLCGTGSLLLKATAGTNGTTIKWYDASVGGKLVAQGSSLQTPSISSSTTFYLTSYNTSTQCETDSRTSVRAIIHLVPGLPTIASDSSCGTGSVQLKGSAGQNGTTLRWYDASKSGNLLNTSNNYTTNSLSATTSYYASTYNAATGCESANRASGQAIIHAVPSLATTTSADTCGSASLVLSATSGINGNEIRWYDASANGTLLSTGSNYTTQTLSSTTSFYAASYNNLTGCEASTRTASTATIHAIPAQPTVTNDSVCGNGIMTLKAKTGSNGSAVRWYDASINGTLLAQSDDYTTASLSTTTTYYTTSYNVSTSCESPQTTPVRAIVHSIPGVPTLKGDERCDDGTLTLTGTSGTNANAVLWYVTNIGGSVLAKTDSFKTPSLKATTDYFASSFSDLTGCESSSRSSVKAVINPLPDLPFTQEDSVCGQGSMTLKANPGLNGDTCRWFASGTGGNVLDVNESFNTPNLTKTTFYYVSSYNTVTGCESESRKSVRAIVHSLPGAPTPTDNSRTGSGTVSLSAVAGTNSSTVNWYDELTADNNLKQGLQYTTATIDTNTTYYIASFNANTGCESDPRVAVIATVYPRPQLGFDIPEVICDGDEIEFVNTTSVKEGKLTYLWKFGDGKFSADKNPKYTFGETGSYQVTLVVTTENNFVDSTFKLVEVNELPQSDFTITNRGSKTLVLIPEDITQAEYAWDFGDGSTGTNIIETHKFDAYSFFIIKLEVTSEEGCKSSSQELFDLNTGVEESVRKSISLVAYPNPFNHETTVEYNLPSSELMDVAVYNTQGQLVERLHSGRQSAGSHVYRFQTPVSGVYYLKVSVGDATAIMKLVKTN